MKFRFDGQRYLMRLEQGEQLTQSLRYFIEELNIKTAWLQGLGGVNAVELGYYQLSTQQYIWRLIRQPLELISLQGNISVGEDGQPAMHLHGTFSDAAMHAFGGHIKEAEIAATCEILITVWQRDPIRRQHDNRTGLSLLQL